MRLTFCWTTRGPAWAAGLKTTGLSSALLVLCTLCLAGSLAAAPAPKDASSRAAKARYAQQVAELKRADPVSRPDRKAERARRDAELAQRLEGRLFDAWEGATAEGPVRAAKSLRDSGGQVEGTNVVVIVQCATNANPADVAAAIAGEKGNVVRTGDAHVKAVVPIAALDRVAKLPGVSLVRGTIRPREKSLTEGCALTGACRWHAAGFTGQGVKVAVIDTGFAGLPDRQAAGDIPASAVGVDFSGEGLTVGTDHGCSCAEVIYSMAPGVQLYLLKALDPSDDQAAKDYCKNKGIQIISQSGGYDCINFHDGIAYSSISPHPVAIVNDAAASGILWINAAGNEQVQHAMTPWKDADPANPDGYSSWTPSGDEMNELWNGGDPVPAGEVLDIYLTWNAWPVTDQDFDLDLYRLDGNNWTYITSASDVQNGSQAPREHLNFTVTNTAHYAVSIYRYKATRSPRFILRSYPYELYYYGYDNTTTPVGGSICIPGDAASSFTVGAINYSTYTNGPIEWFSSLGPNNGAYTSHPSVVKPDICGPDFVTTASAGVENFGGTSAATPHIAALAALVKGRYPSYTNTQLRDYLERHGINLGAAGKDNTYGSGPCVLGPGWVWNDSFGWLWDFENNWHGSLSYGYFWFDPSGWLWSISLNGALGPSANSRTLWSPQFGWLTPASSFDGSAYTSSLGWIHMYNYAGTPIPANWVVSDCFGFVWPAGDRVWYYSERNGWLGVTAGGGIWSVDANGWVSRCE